MALCLLVPAASAQETLREGFDNPPSSARPRVWWHWMNANISKEGIRKDLLWMNRAGIVGFHNFDAGLETPQIVKERLPYMTEGWKDAFNYALDLADSLKMEVTIASSPGWSVTGGPWVDMDDAMKKISWVETVLEGGRVFKGPLPEPIMVCGEYQDVPKYASEPHKYDYYKDIAVVAVKLPDADRSMEELGARLSFNQAVDKDDYSTIVCEFPEPQMIKSLRFRVEEQDKAKFNRVVEYSQDGISYSILLPMLPDCSSIAKTVDFTPVKARFFRIRNLVPGESMQMHHIRFCPVTLVNIDTEKAGFFTSASIREFWPTPHTEDGIPMFDVVDLTGKYKNGLLSWKVPAGRWRIFRFGYNLTGKHNSPASPEATGLEVDKYDAAAVRRYYKNYLAMYDEASNGRVGKVITHLMIDSYEARCQTWTAAMPEEFLARRGYGLIKWLPALTGQIIGSSEDTEKFLADWRQTLSDLMSENHYDVVTDILEERGMYRYTESQEQYRAYVCDGMDPKRKAHIPMSAFWMKPGFYSSYPACETDIRESASVSHIYGQKVVAAESFTTDGLNNETARRAWAPCPSTLKPLADAALSCGLNRFVIHCSPHQPSDDHVPGLGLGKYGQWFTRHETWAEEARAWTDYLSRSSFMMQQGRFVADIAYMYGETVNLSARFKNSYPEIPSGYAFDYINRTILLDVLKIRDGKLVTDSGMTYSVLVIDKEVEYMSDAVRKRIAQIEAAGVPVVRGYCEEALKKLGIPRDVEILPASAADIRYVHRSLPEGEMYWVANITPEYRTLDVSFRTSGFKPQIWHADTGLIEDADYSVVDGRTIVKLHMVPDDAQFVMFTIPSSEKSFSGPTRIESRVQTVNGEWTVSFQPGRQAPSSVVFPTLKSYTDFDDPGIKYFSGTAVYTGSFSFENKDSSSEYWLDLGDVHHMARVSLNGKDLGLLWKKPYKVNVTGIIAEGENKLEIKVINSWVNRLIGDEQPGVKDRVTYTAIKFYKAEDSLVPAGLLGPVQINSIKTI